MRINASVVRVLAGVAAFALPACSGGKGAIDKAHKEIGLQAETLMQKNEVPRDQAHFDELTEVAGCPADPWGKKYRYERLGVRNARIYSLGPDEKQATADDISEEFLFPSGTGLESLKVVRPDGSEAIKSPDGARSFWVTQKDVGDKQITDYWVGDATGVAEKPIRSATIDTDDYRRGVTLTRWSMDGKYLVVKDFDSGARPDAETRQSAVTFDAATGKPVDPATLPADLAWQDY